MHYGEPSNVLPLRYHWRSLTIRRTTTMATATGIALVAFVFASVLMLLDGIRHTLGRSASPSSAIVLREGSDAELGSIVGNEVLAEVLARPEVALAADGKPLG